jgi:hypothetical protein
MKTLCALLLLTVATGSVSAQPIKLDPMAQRIYDQNAAEKAQQKAIMVMLRFLANYFAGLFGDNSTSLSFSGPPPTPRVLVAGASATFPFTPVAPIVLPYFNQAAAAPLAYSPVPTASAPAGITPDAFQIAFLDGAGSSLVVIDADSLSVISQVNVPSTSGPLGIRPSLTGASNEIWVADAATQLSVSNIASQSLVTNIPTPSIPQASTPAGIVFTPDGATAFEAFAYQSPDASGNNGALLVFDAVNRKAASTVPLKYGPTAILIAPDGLTVYLLSGSGELTYYDVLSGTAGLSVSTFTPGVGGGYPGAAAAVFMHPSGSRLLWNTNYLLEEFDLTTHTLTSFNSGLPSTSAASMTMSQDGQRAYFSNGAANLAVVSTNTGFVLATYNLGAPALVLDGPPLGQ